MNPENEVRRLYDGLRNPILHEYGTRDVALTDGHPEEHWQMIDGGIRVLNLESLIEVFEQAFDDFIADSRTTRGSAPSFCRRAGDFSGRSR